jgi:peptidoglycan/LPS O-acetylase OafA/YrhL
LKNKRLLEIDFLKSIAIIFVFLFHLFPVYFPGGFIGVDIFLVVTGFLSAMSLSKTAALDFVKNRLRRIYPSLSLMYFVIFIFIAVFGFYNEILSFCKYLISSTLLLTNVHLYLDTGYFSESVNSNFLYHLWSISLEVQIWFIFAIVFFFKSIKIARMLALLSFIVTIYSLATGNVEQFYLNPLLRFWEAWLGYEAFHLKQKKVFSDKLKLEYILIGLFLVFITVDLKIFYLLWLVSPFLCFSLLITKSSSKFLNLDIWVYFSSRTYALYLWHVPVIVGFGYYLNVFGIAKVASVMLSTILLSEWSYRWIEKNEK